MTGEAAFDVVVLGEVLLEVGTEQPFGHGVPARLQVSGDALNVAACAAAAGARVGLACVLTDDELGDAVLARVDELGVSTALVRRRRGQQGMYLVHSDPEGQREFAYARSGSVGSSLSVDDLDLDVLAEAGAVVASGITCAVSASAAAAVRTAAGVASRFVYDPNFRPRLTSAAEAGVVLRELAARAWLVTPSFPGETSALLGVGSAVEAGRALRALGAEAVAVTCGAEGVQLVAGSGETWVDAVPAPAVLDQTGAGDAVVGTLTARLVRGDDLVTATGLAVAAASLVVGGRGGTGLVPTLEQTRAHAATAG
ncbi:carbohydrate kinase family protein [Microlunatus capsulatus]|uniref:2-dehydro-3-deoxygluconokinase n=1 Tax=Microlunatus capsulatus TaxID=99117 RepID=A0ABS4Z892_9ACTN|nr:PfkB family carbohydrate kinase [Microlunatus capsulatus]MBP2417265.1 2-dehydro-3-deoxygluconokinase [Microlunatus capsulatus]